MTVLAGRKIPHSFATQNGCQVFVRSLIIFGNVSMDLAFYSLEPTQNI